MKSIDSVTHSEAVPMMLDIIDVVLFQGFLGTFWDKF